MATESELRTVAHNVVHLRAKPTNDSELVSQLLMGQTVRILKEEAGWSYIEGEDTYRGWADNRWLIPQITDEREPIAALFGEVRETPDHNAPLQVRLPMLAQVQIVAATENGWIEVALPGENRHGFIGAQHGLLPFRGLSFIPPPAEEIARIAIRRSRDFLGTPYLWGGSSSYGLDCSGLVQYCYAYAGIILRRDADIQRSDERFAPVPVETVAQAGDSLLPGDLVFFGRPDRITHIGMHLEENRFIHSAGGAGVIVSEWGDDRYSPGFVDARRLDPVRAKEPVMRFESETR